MSHRHEWRPRSDIGLARYDCACGAHAKRTHSGHFALREPPEPEPTVRVSNPRERPGDDSERARLRPKHSDLDAVQSVMRPVPGPRRGPVDQFRATVAWGIIHGKTDSQIARQTGKSRERVRQLREWFLRDDRPTPWGTR